MVSKIQEPRCVRSVPTQTNSSNHAQIGGQTDNHNGCASPFCPTLAGNAEFCQYPFCGLAHLSSIVLMLHFLRLTVTIVGSTSPTNTSPAHGPHLHGHTGSERPHKTFFTLQYRSFIASGCRGPEHNGPAYHPRSVVCPSSMLRLFPQRHGLCSDLAGKNPSMCAGTINFPRLNNIRAKPKSKNYQLHPRLPNLSCSNP